MYQSITMSASFEAEKNRKAFAYTAIICAVLLLLAIFITWPLTKPPVPIVEDLIEINLGNETEGAGTVQPLIKGEKAPGDQVPEPEQKQAIANNEPDKQIEADDNTDKDAAPVNKPVKATTPKINPTPTPAPAPAPKPQRPKIAGYGGPKGGTGNGATEDKGFKYQGNNPNGKGDAGNPNGKPDSYGNNPGGHAGGTLRVSKGDRTIINNYIFMDELPKATINAIIKVSPEGRGTFVTFDKGSTSNDPSYAAAIRRYLPNIQFNKADKESIVTVPFNFRVQ